MDPIVSAACERLAQGRAFVMATIIHRQGSSPRMAGTRMFITPEQQIVGTIGGGLLEAKTMQAAARMTEKAPACFLDFDLTNEDAANMQMICGGRVRVLLDYIQPSQEHLALFTRWQQELSNGDKAMLVSRVFGSKTSIQRIGHALFKNDTCIHGRLDAEAAGATLQQWGTHATHVQVLDLEDGLMVADPGQTAPWLYIFGAGHVARPTAHMAAMVGFGVVIIDDRAEFAHAARFPEAVAVHSISSFDAAFERLTVNADSYIVIVTRGHLHDRSVLAQALRTPASYIGMIGSRRKRDAIYDSLLKDGYRKDDIARVHSPIGLKIGADTPEEIAVSIIAELIAVRAGVTT